MRFSGLPGTKCLKLSQELKCQLIQRWMCSHGCHDMLQSKNLDIIAPCQLINSYGEEVAWFESH